MQGDQVKSLRIIAEAKGWDPTKIIGGESVEVGLKIPRGDDLGDKSLSPFLGPAGDAAVYDNPVLQSKVSWEIPGETTNDDKRTEGANPFPGKPL